MISCSPKFSQTECLFSVAFTDIPYPQHCLVSTSQTFGSPSRRQPVSHQRMLDTYARTQPNGALGHCVLLKFRFGALELAYTTCLAATLVKNGGRRQVAKIVTLFIKIACVYIHFCIITIITILFISIYCTSLSL